MTNDPLKQALQDGLQPDVPDTAHDVELTDSDLDDIAGGWCSGYCASYTLKSA